MTFLKNLLQNDFIFIPFYVVMVRFIGYYKLIIKLKNKKQQKKQKTKNKNKKQKF